MPGELPSGHELVGVTAASVSSEADAAPSRVNWFLLGTVFGVIASPFLWEILKPIPPRSNRKKA